MTPRPPGNTTGGGRLSTVDLLIKVACFVKIIFSKQRGADLNLMVQGGQPYLAFSFSKTSLVRHVSDIGGHFLANIF